MPESISAESYSCLIRTQRLESILSKLTFAEAHSVALSVCGRQVDPDAPFLCVRISRVQDRCDSVPSQKFCFSFLFE